MSQPDFLRALQTYLHRVAQAPSNVTSEDPPQHAIDPRWSRSLLLRLLQRMETEKFPRDQGATMIGPLVYQWQTADRVVVFVRELRRMLCEGLAFQASDAEVQALIEVGLARRLGFSDRLPSLAQTYELDRVAAIADQIARQSPGVFVGLDILQYSAANQLVVPSERGKRLSPLGDVMAKLQGKDAVRWLLQIESRQALGPRDADRLSRDAAAALLAAGSWDDDPDSPEPKFPCHPDTARRLCELSLLQQEFHHPGADGSDPSMWHITPLGHELLSEIVLGSENPLSLLAASLCSDVLSTALTPAAAARAPTVTAAAEMTARQARMVAHEIRNSLLPVQAAMDSLISDLRVLPVDEALQRRQATIEGGLRHALSFTGRLLQVAELGAKPAARFEPVHVLREVIEQLEHPTSVRIQLSLAVSGEGTGAPLLLGDRERFGLAIRELLKNAIRHGGAELRQVKIHVQRSTNESALTVHVDDDGCGVPEPYRARIFEVGVSQRPGGTGHGLDLVRQVIEADLDGTVVCTQSAMGGARFALRLPIARSDARSPVSTPALQRKDLRK